MGELLQVWREYVRGRNPELRRRLIEAYAPLARYVVERLNIRPGAAVGYEDLLAQAVVGLIDAVDRFDPERGIKFETYAYHRIRGSVMDMLREMDWAPRSLRDKEAQVSAACADLQMALGRPPSDEELARALGLSVAELDELAHNLALQAMQSLDELVRTAEDESGPAWELVADEQEISPEEHVARRAEQELLARALDALPETERTVISLYYYEGLTLREIGEVLGVTESRVCQIHGKAILRMRAHVEMELASGLQLARERGQTRLPLTAEAPTRGQVEAWQGEGG